MRIALIITFSYLILFIASCESEESSKNNNELTNTSSSEMYARCNCPFGKVGGDYRDSTTTTTTLDNKAQARGEVSFNQLIKKYIDLQLAASYKQNNKKVETKMVVQNIVDRFPELTNLVLLEKDLFCAYIQLRCKDTSLSDAAFYEDIRAEYDNVKIIIRSFYKVPAKKEVLSVVPIASKAKKKFKVSLVIYVDKIGQMSVPVYLKNDKQSVELIPTRNGNHFYVIEKTVPEGEYTLEWITNENHPCSDYSISLEVHRAIEKKINYQCL